MGELGRDQEVHEVVLPKFSKEYKDAMAIKGEEVLTLSPRRKRDAKNVREH